MKTILIIIFTIALSACSSEKDSNKHSVNGQKEERPTAINQQSDITSMGHDPNLIRKQTESDFRSINPQNSRSYNSLKSDSYTGREDERMPSESDVNK
jgi:hypothetical protein